MNNACVQVEPSRLAKDMAAHLNAAEEAKFYRWIKGASALALPQLQVVEACLKENVGYVTAGASKILDRPGYGTEFCYIANAPSCSNVELLAMVSYMHADPAHRLGVGHTVKIGRPVADGSHLDRLLISVPYPYGSNFEYMHAFDGSHVRILWLLPISESEERFCHEMGLERLEELFEEHEIDFANPMRLAVI